MQEGEEVCPEEVFFSLGEKDDVKGLDLGAPTPSDPTICLPDAMRLGALRNSSGEPLLVERCGSVFSLGVGQTHDQTTGTTETHHQNEDDDEQDDDDTPLILSQLICS